MSQPVSLNIPCRLSGDGGMLVWDKDDAPAMDFVCAAANIRAQIFSIATNSRFQVRIVFEMKTNKNNFTPYILKNKRYGKLELC